MGQTAKFNKPNSIQTLRKIRKKIVKIVNPDLYKKVIIFFCLTKLYLLIFLLSARTFGPKNKTNFFFLKCRFHQKENKLKYFVKKIKLKKIYFINSFFTKFEI